MASSISSWPLAQKLGLAEKPRLLPASACGRAAAANRVAVGEHHTVACADHGLRIDLIGEADARSEVLAVVIDRRGAVAGVGSGAGELQGAVEPLTGFARLGLKKLMIVVHFAERREVIPAKAEVEGQLRESPSSCPEHRERWRGSASRTPARDSGVRLPFDLADEEAGIGETGVGVAA